jgi:phage shock protein C
MGKLARSETDKKIAGIAGGMAAYWALDPTLVRVLWVIAVMMGWGLLAYGLLWIVLPKGTVSSPAARAAEERFARGEITPEDLRHIKETLGGGPGRPDVAG